MVEGISPAELADRLEADRPTHVVDVRPQRAFERAHIPGSDNVPITEFVERIDDVAWGNYIVCVCPHGESSLQAARLLSSYEGLDEGTVVANLEGGLETWQGDVTRAESEFDDEAPF